MASMDGIPVSMVSERVESSADSSTEDEDWTDEELELLTKAVAKLTYSMASLFDEERSTELIRDMRRIEATVASLIAEGKSAEISTKSQEIDASIDGSSTPPSSDPSDLLKSDQKIKSMDDEEGDLPLQALEELLQPQSDERVDLTLAKELPSFTAHQVLDKLSTDTRRKEIEAEQNNIEKTHTPLMAMNSLTILVHTHTIDEISQPRCIMAGNLSINHDHVLPPMREFGNVRVMANDCDELLSFDPGGDFLMVRNKLLEKSPKSVNDNPILVKELASLFAHQVFDKSPEFMEKGIELFDAFPKEIGWAESAASINKEQATLSFDPGFAVGNIPLISEINKGIVDGLKMQGSEKDCKAQRTKEEHVLSLEMSYVNQHPLGVVGPLGIYPGVGECIELPVFDPGGSLLFGIALGGALSCVDSPGCHNSFNLELTASNKKDLHATYADHVEVYSTNSSLRLIVLYPRSMIEEKWDRMDFILQFVGTDLSMLAETELLLLFGANYVTYLVEVSASPEDNMCTLQIWVYLCCISKPRFRCLIILNTINVATETESMNEKAFIGTLRMNSVIHAMKEKPMWFPKCSNSLLVGSRQQSKDDEHKSLDKLNWANVIVLAPSQPSINLSSCSLLSALLLMVSACNEVKIWGIDTWMNGATLKYLRQKDGASPSKATAGTAFGEASNSAKLVFDPGGWELLLRMEGPLENTRKLSAKIGVVRTSITGATAFVSDPGIQASKLIDEAQHIL